MIGIRAVTTPVITTSTTFPATSTTVISTSQTTTSTSFSTMVTSTTTSTTSTSTSFSYTSTYSTTTTNTTTFTSYTATATTFGSSTQPTTVTQGSTSTIFTGPTTTALPGLSCPVAFATSGTPLGPYANFLRGFRNNQIQNTTAGGMFMQTFNGWYYSWAPSVTYAAARNGWFLDVLRVGVYPLIGILYAAYFSYAVVSPISAEAGALAAGVVAASLIGLVYVAPVAYVSLRLVRRRTKFLTPARTYLLPASGGVAASALMIGAAYLSGSALLMGLGTASMTLSMLSVGSLLGARALTSVQFPVVNLHAKVFAMRRMARPLH